MPKVLNKRNLAGRNIIPDGAVLCDRTTRWGNPFKMRNEADRETVCDRFRDEILPTLDVSELRGKDLVCWCAPKRCHCDDILVKANK